MTSIMYFIARYDIDATLLIALVAIGVAALQYHARWELRDELRLTRELLDGLLSSAKIEDNLNHVLLTVSRVVRASHYAFYLWDTHTERFLLRSVSHPYDMFEGVGPAYSGLALPKREAYLPPVALEDSIAEQPLSMVKHGEVPLVMLRIGDSKGLIRISPVRVLSRRQRRYLTEISCLVAVHVEGWINLESERDRMELRALSDAAIAKVASLANQAMLVLPVLLQAFVGIAGGKGGLFIEHLGGGGVRVHANDALDANARALEKDVPGCNRAEKLAVHPEETVIMRSDAAFYDLPAALTLQDDVSAIVLVSFGDCGTLVILFDSTFNAERWQQTGRRQLRFLTNQVNRMIRQAADQRKLTKRHARLLCQIAGMVDSLNPFTIGYSDMVARYSLVIGKELELSEAQMHDLTLAAYLSNIGVIGLDMKRLSKEGKYSDGEYSIMKRHAEIGASMIELVTGNRRAAEYVLHHHERVDGNGYPHGLTGDDIPIGAKILHVVQVFLAKVSGRSWRSPLPFDQALEDLQRSVGSALDEKVVLAFKAWLARNASRLEAAEERAHGTP